MGLGLTLTLALVGASSAWSSAEMLSASRWLEGSSKRTTLLGVRQKVASATRALVRGGVGVGIGDRDRDRGRDRLRVRVRDRDRVRVRVRDGFGVGVRTRGRARVGARVGVGTHQLSSCGG